MRRTFILSSCIFFSSFLSAQENQKMTWNDFIPDFSSSNYIMPGIGTGIDGVKNHTLSALSAYLNPGGKLEFYLAYDVLKEVFSGCEVTYRPSKSIEVHAGVMRLPHLQEITYSPRYLEAVGFSQATAFLGAYGHDLSGVNARGRDMGIMVKGSLLPQQSYSAIEYYIGVFNGNGYSFRDNDHSKDVAGRIVYHPTADWTISAGGYYGRYALGDGRGIAYDHADTDAKSAVRKRFSTAVWYDNKSFFLRSENIYGITDGLRSNGFSALTGYWLNKHFAPSLRYEQMMTDTSDKKTRMQVMSFCLTYMFTRDMSVRLQYDHKWNMIPSRTDGDFLTSCLIFRFNERHKKNKVVIDQQKE